MENDERLRSKHSIHVPGHPGFLTLDILGRDFAASSNESDRSWIRVDVSCDTYGFHGFYRTQIQIGDLARFRADLAASYQELGRQFQFRTLEGVLALDCHGDGLGHFDIAVTATSTWNPKTQLMFHLAIDQTEIPQLLAELDAALEALG